MQIKYLSRFFIFILLIAISIVQNTFADEVVLQDSKLLVAFDSNTGALVRMENKTTGWVIERRAKLGMSFRLFVPLPEQRYNFVLSQNQKAEKVEKISDKVV